MRERIINKNITEELLLLFAKDIKEYPNLKENIKLIVCNLVEEYRKENNFIFKY